MERSLESGRRWILVPGQMRVAAILLGLWGTQTLVYGYFYAITLLPSPLDGPVVSLVVGIAAIAAALGILRAEPWARAVGLVVMAAWALELLVAIARSLVPPLDLASNMPVIASWAVGLVLFGFVARELLWHWPQARPQARPGARDTVVRLAIVLVPIVVIGVALRPSEPEPFEPPPPLGPAREGGYIELPSSGFALTLPADWSVEVGTPERDPVGAAPGEAWEALRAFDPSRQQTCSVSVAVSPSTTSREGYDVGSMSGDERAPRWSGTAERPMLMLPDSSDRVEALGGPHASQMTTQVRYARSGGGHDILYAIECGGGAGSPRGGIADSLTLLPPSPWMAVDGNGGPTNQPSPSRLPPSGQRVEIPQAGMALTIPAEWGFRVEMRPTDWATEAPVAATIWQVLDSWSPAGDPEAATEHCSLGMLEVSEQSVDSMVIGLVSSSPSCSTARS